MVLCAKMALVMGRPDAILEPKIPAAWCLSMQPTIVPDNPELNNSRDPICEICGSRMVERHCKVQCLNCGFTRDCSDP